MKIALIGCGNMGEAVLAGLHQKCFFHIVELRPERRHYLKEKYRCAFADVAGALKASEVIILAVKPQDFSQLLEDIAQHSLKGKLFISIAAGVTTAFIEEKLGASARVVRVMPNLPAVIGEGVTALCKGKRASLPDLKKAEDIFASVGETLVVKEDMIDAVTAVSGSGPAYLFLVVECLMKAALELGFKEKDAKILVYKTLLGSAHMLAQSKDTAGELRQKVTSKGGTTQAATDVFMNKGIMEIFGAALKAARNRAKELSK